MAVGASWALKGKSVLVTRSRAQGTEMVQRLRDWDAVPHWIPAIAGEPGTPRQLAQALAAAQTCDWLVLPSPLAIEVFCDFALPAFPGSGWPRTVVMGEASGRLLRQRYRIEPALVYAFAHGASMAVQMGLLPHEKVVVLRSDRGSGPRVAELVRGHGHAESHAIYAVRCHARLVPALSELRVPVDAVTFASPSTVACFMQAAEQLPRVRGWLAETCLACLGPATAQALYGHGLAPHVVCATPSIENLLGALARWFAGKYVV